MRTDDLIRALAASSLAPEPPVGRHLALALVFGGMAALGLMLAGWGPRPDLGAALGTLPVLAKPLIGALAGIGAVAAALAAARPGARPGGWAWALAAAGALAILVLAAGFAATPAAAWAEAMAGTRAWSVAGCLSGIAAVAAPLWVALLAALRHGAPTDPRRAGALAGLAAGGIGAALYALACTEDAALFFGLWYPLAILAFAAAGAAIGPRVLRW